MPPEPIETDKPLALGSWSNYSIYQNGAEKPKFLDHSIEEVNRAVK
jgi:hypothetical protein